MVGLCAIQRGYDSSIRICWLVGVSIVVVVVIVAALTFSDQLDGMDLLFNYSFVSSVMARPVCPFIIHSMFIYSFVHLP